MDAGDWARMMDEEDGRGDQNCTYGDGLVVSDVGQAGSSHTAGQHHAGSTLRFDRFLLDEDLHCKPRYGSGIGMHGFG